MKLDQKKVGIWGWGVVGRSVYNFLQATQPDAVLWLYDDLPVVWTQLSDEVRQRAQICADLPQFLTGCDLIVPSPGVNLTLHHSYAHKFWAELDLFAAYFKKPVLVVTGSLGKTTTVTVLAQLLQKLGYRVGLAGNIGIGMCDLILRQSELDLAVLEISSFQAEWVHQFKPNWLLWTNFFPNHLDRHATITQYFNAKLNLITQLHSLEHVLLPETVWQQIIADYGTCSDEQINLFNLTLPAAWLARHKFYYQGDYLVCAFSNGLKKLVGRNLLASNILPANWLGIIGLLYCFDARINFEKLLIDYQFSGLEHRLEKFWVAQKVEFYNDSKATVAESTLAALTKFGDRRVILILGGCGKGVSRCALIQELANYKNLRGVICFGIEAPELHGLCQKYLIPSWCGVDLAFVGECLDQLIRRDCDVVLFSPAGSSFDLFQNYVERGVAFKQLVCRHFAADF